MRKEIMKTTLLTVSMVAMASEITPTMAEEQKDPYAGLPVLTINGTGNTATLEVSSKDLLNKDINIKLPYGFEASSPTIAAGGKTKVDIKLVSSKDSTIGKLILRNGDIRKYIKLVGLGSPLPQKDLSAKGNANGDKLSKSFKPGKNGYTIEFKLKTMEDGQNFYPWFVDANGYGFKAYVSANEIGLYSNPYKKGIANPLTDGKTGGGKYYNNDGKSHTYRIAVTPDNRAFIYRDGVELAVVRTEDYGPQPFFADGNGKMKENLLKNGDFEGEYEMMKIDNTIVGAIQGWDIVIGDRWNSQQDIQKEAIDNEYDIDNNVFMLRPYKWGAGWSDGILQQVVDVAPNETYTLTAMCKGGQDEGAKNGPTNTGKLGIEELQDNTKKNIIPITSTDWETYSIDYTTSADCKQIVVRFTDGRGGWGNKIKPIYVDNVKLTGIERKHSPKYGFDNEGAQLEYFTIDESGAYAPANVPTIDVKF